MKKIELIREGVKRGFFQENNRPEDVLDCGIHSGRKFEDVYLHHESYVKWVLELKHPHMWSSRCFRYFLMRLMDLERILKGGREQDQKMREARLEMSESLGGGNGFGGREFGGIHFHWKLKQLFFFIRGGLISLCSYSFWRRSNYFFSS